MMGRHLKKSVKKTWKTYLESLDFTFQAIVNIHNGICYGYEAVLHNYQQLGFHSRHAFLKKAQKAGLLQDIELSLYHKVIKKYARLSTEHSAILFLPVDNSLWRFKSYDPDSSAQELKRYNLSPDMLCFEISERHEQFSASMLQTLSSYQKEGFKIGLNHFGTGLSELLCFYHANVNFIKIDRFFIHDIAADTKKQLIASNILNMAHMSGTMVIAAGIDSRQDFCTCRNLGIDLVQGNFIQPPEQDESKLLARYEDHIHPQLKQERRQRGSDRTLLQNRMEFIPSIPIDTDIFDVFDKFRKHRMNKFFPVVNNTGYPIGIIHENDLKKYTYSQYGRDLLKNPSSNKELKDFLSPMPLVDIHSSLEKILAVFSMNEHVEGILIVEHERYIGFLSGRALLQVLHEKSLTFAREQNPLSKLPGNMMIHEYISHVLDRPKNSYALVYFDFDHFKPFNDKYGFRLGDRAILLFADLLKVRTHQSLHFAGHIGGDDFFMGFENVVLDEVKHQVQEIVQRFKRDVKSFYDQETQEQGYITAENREGHIKKFDLLTVSAVILELPTPRPIYTTEHLGTMLATFKKRAKQSAEGMYTANILDL